MLSTTRDTDRARVRTFRAKQSAGPEPGDPEVPTSIASPTRTERRGLFLLPAVVWSTVLAAVLLWPLRRSGYLIGRDMVFTARPHLSWATLGLGSGSPRAVPVDWIVSAASSVLGGAAVSRIGVVVPLLLVGTGVAMLFGRGHVAAGLVATTFAVWNPYVVERLAMGDWSLLWAYGALPWIVRAASSVRSGAAPGVLLLWIAAASITPTGGLIAVVAAAVFTWAGRPALRRWWLCVAGAIALQLPWIVPGLVGPAHLTSDPAGVAAFAARAEHAGGALLSLLGGGGAWNAEAVPPSRSGWLAWIGLVVVCAGVCLGWQPAADTVGRTNRARLAWTAAGACLLATVSSVPGGDALMRAVVRDLPGAGLLRDAQKWLMPAVLFLAVALGCASVRLTRAPAVRMGASLALIALPLVLLPDAASTLRPVMTPAHYPTDWAWAEAATGRHGSVVVLPFQPYRAFDWAPGRPVLDPAPRILPGDVVVSDRLTVAGVTIGGEDSTVVRVAAALAPGKPVDVAALSQAGIGWVLVEHGTPGRLPELGGLRLARSGTALSLYRVPGHVAEIVPSSARIAMVLTGDALAVLVLVGAVAIERHRWRRLLKLAVQRSGGRPWSRR